MNKEKRPLKVFLCHAHSDRDKVRVLYSRLKREGVDAWLDKEKLLPGADWEYEIRKAVRESDVIVVCLSKDFNQAGFRQKEVRIALDAATHQPDGEIFIIPARLEECENLESLSKWHWVDLFEDGGYQSLIRALRARADRIGATLRIRGGGKPIVSPPMDEESKKAEQDRLAKAAREEQEREAAEKNAREKAEKDAAEKARLEAEEQARQKAAKENAEREAAEKVAREKAESESVKELPQSVQDRILEAAIQKQIVVDKPASLYVWIKQSDSKSIISVVKSDIDENVVLDENNVKSKGLEIEFPIEQGKVTNASISLRLVAPEFSPPTQKKEIKVPVNGDSEVCTFLVTPKKAGRLLLNIEVLKDKVSVANRNLWTMAIGTETKESSPMLLVTIPIFVIVQPKQDVININGNVSDSVIVSGDHNAINAEKAILESEKLARQKAEREAAEKAAREKAEKDAAQKVRLQAEEQARQRSAKEKAKREAVEKPARSLLQNKRIIIPIAIVLFLCIIIFAVLPVITKSDISSTPVSPGISDLNLPPFSATEDVYIYFNSDQIPSSQKFESRWFLKVNILWADLYIPVGYLEYIPVNRETQLYFHLKNPGIAGEYRVDIYMDQNLVGTQTFEIHPKE